MKMAVLFCSSKVTKDPIVSRPKSRTPSSRNKPNLTEPNCSHAKKLIWIVICTLYAKLLRSRWYMYPIRTT